MTRPAPDLQPDPRGSGTGRPIYVTGNRYTEMFNGTNLPPSVQSADSSSTPSLDNPDVPASVYVPSPSHTPTRHSHPPLPTREWTPPRAGETVEAVSEDPHSFASRDGFAKLSLMYQTAPEATEAVSDDPYSSAYQDAFGIALSASLNKPCTGH
jgi:hypothetical protein